MRILSLLACLLLASVCAAQEHNSNTDTPATGFEQALIDLGQKNFARKADAIARIEASAHPRAIPALRALADGALYQRKSDQRVVIAGERLDTDKFTDALTGETLPKVDTQELSKLPINNAMRGQLRMTIARMSLGNSDSAIRLNAVRDLSKVMNAESAELLRPLAKSEPDEAIRLAAATAVALMDIASPEITTRLEAVAALGESLLPEARARLSQLLEARNDSGFIEQQESVRAAAAAALRQIDNRLQIYAAAETVFFGLSLGSVLLLAAIGLAITFGVMGVINMAHGELMMLGAYTTYVVQLLMPNYIDVSLFVAVPAAFCVAGLTGIAIERGVIRFLYGRPLETLLATFGVSLVLQQLVRSIFSPLNRSVETPSWMSGSVEINSALSLTLNRLYIIVFALLVFAALLLLLKKTVFGLQVRAVAQNRQMAQAMGIRSRWIDSLTFGLGSGIAGVAGVALSQLTNVGPNLGQSYIIDSFMVVVFGGVGNLWGMLVGAFSLGVVNKFMEPWTGAVLAKILVLVLIILFIQKRPRGLFPQKGRAAEA